MLKHSYEFCLIGFKALFGLTVLFDIMKYTENNFQAFIAIEPSIVYSGDTFDLSATDRRCSLDKLISTPDITTDCGPRLPNKIPRRFEMHRYASVLQVRSPPELCWLDHGPVMSPISPDKSSFARAYSSKHSAVLGLAWFWVWHACAREGSPAG